jgi:pentatricopeptide repeat protein
MEIKMFTNRKLTTIICFVIAVSLFPAISISKNEYSYCSKKDFEESIYLFENMINKKSPPTLHDYEKLFSFESELELSVELIESITRKTIPCSFDKECFNNKSNPSLLFGYLRSPESPFFRGTNKNKIKIYIYNNYKFKIPENDDGFLIDAMIYIDDKHIYNCQFNLMIYKYDTERINGIEINGKSLSEWIDEYKRDKLQNNKK